MKISPDILILSSELQPFVYETGHSIVVNIGSKVEKGYEWEFDLINSKYKCNWIG